MQIKLKMWRIIPLHGMPVQIPLTLCCHFWPSHAPSSEQPVKYNAAAAAVAILIWDNILKILESLKNNVWKSKGLGAQKDD